ncbi:hypothetical protein FB451DRAFT_1264717 [Mycena latifolia]|nr:hypothetical protein FB451DRAFT_1264717 [Mycena latifolia]
MHIKTNGWGIVFPNVPFHRLVAVYDRRTASVYPLRSLACSMLLMGGGMAALTAPMGAIPYAIEGAVKAPTRLRLPSAVTLMRVGALSIAVPWGITAAIMPLGSYATERCGLPPDSKAGFAMQACCAGAGFLWASKRCAPQGHFAAERGSAAVVAAASLVFAVWSRTLRPSEERQE